MEIELSVLVDAPFRAKVDQPRLQSIVRRVLHREGIVSRVTLGLLITSDEKIKSLNLEYRSRDAETDVLAFGGADDLSGFRSPPSGPLHLGDVVVSYPRAASQAHRHGHTTEEEMDRLVIHGVLHLLGYSDEGNEEREDMWDRQETILGEVRETLSGHTIGPAGASLPPECVDGGAWEDTGATARNSLADSFRFAYAGFWYTLKTQRNARIHLAMALAIVPIGAILKLGATEWAVLGLTVGFVFAAEMVNTALEAVIDLVTEEYHPLAKQAKDIAAGAVLAAAITAVAVGLLVLGPALLVRLGWKP